MPEYDVLVFGDTCVDLILTDPNIVPQFGQVEKLVESYLLEMGGSCCIFACQAAKLGLKVGLLGRVGEDAFGQLMLTRLQDAGVDTRHVVIDPTLKTGLTVQLVQGDDRAMLTHLGSSNALQPQHVTDELLSSARHLHYGSLYIHTGLLPDWLNILKRARSLGLTISLDTNWDPDDRWGNGLDEALSLVDVFLPNEREALRITHTENLETALEQLRARVPLLALKRGPDGASVYSGAEVLNRSVEPAEPGGDGIGAGDSFDAGFLAGWLRNLPLADCLEIACQCGRAVAGQVGGVQGQPHAASIPQLP